jgi:thiol-disulfide isomerase/thioredoxin
MSFLLKFTWISALLSLCLASHVQANELQIGEDQPEWQVTLLNNSQTLSAANQKGQVVILNFWATWCEPCRREMPLLAQFAQTHKDQGVTVIAISMDSARQMNKVHEFAQQFNLAFAHISQTNTRSLGRLTRLPATFIMDRQGVLRRNGHIGEAMISEQELNAIIEPLLSASKTVADTH